MTISRDEIMARRGLALRDSGAGTVLTKAARAPGSWNADQRTIRFVMSTQEVDRYGDVVVTNGINIDMFMKNPVALWAHSHNVPVGTWSDLVKVSGKPKRLEGTLTVAPEGITEEADKVARLISAGIVRACSIGFLIDWNAIEPMMDADDNWTGGIQFNACELIECSPCSVPANQSALAKAAGDDRRVALEFVEEVLDTWERSPEGLIVPRKVFEDAHDTLTGGLNTVTVSAAQIKSGSIAVSEQALEPTIITVDDTAMRSEVVDSTLENRMAEAIEKALEERDTSLLGRLKALFSTKGQKNAPSVEPVAETSAMLVRNSRERAMADVLRLRGSRWAD